MMHPPEPAADSADDRELDSPAGSPDASALPAAAPDDRPIVVFGGSFDPPHTRHVAVAAGVDRLLRAKRLLIMPAWSNPQRTEGPRASVADRLAMCSLAFQDLPDTEVCTLEVDHAKPSYTVDTLDALHAEQRAGRLPRGRFRLVVGSDQALNFRTWREWERVITLAEPAVVLRPPHEPWNWAKNLASVWDEGWTARWLAWTLPIDPVNVSSTEARRRAESGDDLEELVPAGVAAYIRSRGLYGAQPAHE